MILSVENLSIFLPYRNQIREVVRSLSFSLGTAEILGVVGESACGKSLTNLAVMGLLPNYAQVKADRIVLCGRDLLALNKADWSRIRGRIAAMIFQNPMSALNPTMKIGAQLREAVNGSDVALSRNEVNEKIIELIATVGLPRPRNYIDVYPHELSGGMAQRVMIAMALALKPKLLIADEPTTALDVTTQRQIMELLQHLCLEYSMSMIFVSHDIGLIYKYTDKLQVMYAGEIVESGPTCSIVTQPTHPYTQGLIESHPGYAIQARKTLLPTINGQVPTIDCEISGCRFASRCPIVREECQLNQQLVPNSKQSGVLVRCPY